MGLKPINTIKADLGLPPDDRVQKFFTNACYKAMDKYVPMDTGALADASVGKDSITYKQPYAHYQYKGISRFSGKPLKYSKEKHIYAGSYWDRRMVSAEMQDVVKQVQDFIEKGG